MKYTVKVKLEVTYEEIEAPNEEEAFITACDMALNNESSEAEYWSYEIINKETEHEQDSVGN